MRARGVVGRVAVFGGVAVLAACGGSHAVLAPSSSADAPTALFGQSWMAPQAKRSDLLYVSDNAGRVYVFTYPAGKLVGTLTGLKAPAGLCSDTAGNVYVTNTIAQGILEFAHGGEKPIGGLFDQGYVPNGCGIDSVTGNLAVMNYSTTFGGPGNVAVYTGAHGYPKFYSDPSFNSYLFCTYDAGGNLYVDGVNSGTTQTEFAELPTGSSTFTDITLNRNISYPGAVQWDGQYIAFQDASTDVLYRVKVSGSNGTVVQTVHFKQEHSDLVAQFWIAGSTIIMPFGTQHRRAKAVGFWPYPAGGAPTTVLHAPGSTELYGVTLSLAKK
jgi:hypothetical protein